jgi:hypothetical protein
MVSSTEIATIATARGTLPSNKQGLWLQYPFNEKNNLMSNLYYDMSLIKLQIIMEVLLLIFQEMVIMVSIIMLKWSVMVLMEVHILFLKMKQLILLL